MKKTVLINIDDREFNGKTPLLEKTVRTLTECGYEVIAFRLVSEVGEQIAEHTNLPESISSLILIPTRRADVRSVPAQQIFDYVKKCRPDVGELWWFQITAAPTNPTLGRKVSDKTRAAIDPAFAARQATEKTAKSQDDKVLTQRRWVCSKCETALRDDPIIEHAVREQSSLIWLAQAEGQETYNSKAPDGQDMLVILHTDETCRAC